MQNKIFIEGKIHSITQEQKFIKINLEEMDRPEIKMGDLLRIAGNLVRGGQVLATSIVSLEED